MTIVLGNKNKSHLAFGRTIILELALATKLQLDVGYAAHAVRLEAVDDANAGFGGGRVGMRLAPCGLVDGAEGPLPRCTLLVGAANGHDAPILVLHGGGWDIKTR